MSKLNPKNVSYEPQEVNKIGFTNFSEKVNGRIAMIGFVLLFLFELITKQKIVDYFLL